MEMTEEQIWVIGALLQDHGKKCPKEDSSKTIHQKNTGKSVLSRPSSDGSKNDTSFKTMSEKGQKSTSFKTMANRVKNHNPWYMVPIDEVSQVISDPKSRKKAQPVTEQPSSGPPPLGSRFNPIYVEPRSVSIDSTRDLQALFPNSFDCIGGMQGKYDIKTDPTVPPVQHGRWKVPIEYKEEDQEGASRDGLATENHHQADWAHTMGQQPDVPQKGKWQVEDMPWPQGLEQGNHPWEPQSTNPWGDSSCPHGRHQVLQGRWQQGLLWDAPYRGSLTPHNVQQPTWKVQISTCPLWTQNFTGYLPNEDGWHCGPMPWCIGHPWWCVHLWKEWQGPWCKHHKLVQCGPKRRTCLQQQEMCHKTGVCNVLWWSLLCRRILPRSGEDPRHLWDDTTPDEARATIIPRSSKLPADICSSPQLKH